MDVVKMTFSLPEIFYFFIYRITVGFDSLP